MNNLNDLMGPLQSWIFWLRLRRAWTWGLRGLTLGAGLALLMGGTLLWNARLLRPEFLVLTGGMLLLGTSIAALVAALWPVSVAWAARHFDGVFGLGERVSTALELSQSKTDYPANLVSLQRADAVRAAQDVNPRGRMPLKLPRLEILLTLILLAALTLTWFRGEQWFAASQQTRNVEQAVKEETQDIEELIAQIEQNNSLTEEQKKALTEPLKQAVQELNQNPSLENSVAVLTNSGEKLQSLSDAQTQQMQQGLQNAGQKLAGQEGSPLQSVGQQLAQGDIVSAASQLKNIDVSKLSQAEQQQLADQLNQMAQSLGTSDPQLSQQLQAAAQALQSGDQAAAQQALQNAAQSMAQSGQQVAYSQTAQQAAAQLQQGASQVVAAGGSQQGNSQQAGTQPGQGQGQTPGQGQGQGQTPGQGQGSSGSGSGDGQASPGGEAGSSPIPQNAPSDGGQTTYEPIYAPSLLGGENGPTVNLPNSGDNSGDVIGQGPTTPGDPGASLVPYNEVYSQYDQVNQQAMQNTSIPFQFITIIQSYFNLIRP
jgi:hypothetical protein